MGRFSRSSKSSSIVRSLSASDHPWVWHNVYPLVMSSQAHV
jgi:hypothetical protein